MSDAHITQVLPKHNIFTLRVARHFQCAEEKVRSYEVETH